MEQIYEFNDSILNIKAGIIVATIYILKAYKPLKMLKFSLYLSDAFLFPSFTISTDVIHAVFSPFITHCACVK